SAPRATRCSLTWPKAICTSDMRKLLPLTVVLAAGAARASAGYPTAIVEHLAIFYSPPCSLCHLEGKTGPGTAETPFARSARAHGLEGGDVRLVGVALDSLMRYGTDSDRYGVSDIQVLLAGTDPNLAGAQSIEVRADPASGCKSTGGACGWLALLFAVRSANPSRKRNPSASAPRDAQCEPPPEVPPPPPPPPPL